jgi:hypothetical protein
MKLHRLLLVLGLCAASVLHAATTIVRGPYLQSATPTSMVVRWRTDATEASVVSYGTDRGQLTSVSKSEGVSSEHIVHLNGLQPNTRYYYAVGSIPLAPPAPGKKAAEDAPGRATINSFTTPPPVGHAAPGWSRQTEPHLGARRSGNEERGPDRRARCLHEVHRHSCN